MSSRRVKQQLAALQQHHKAANDVQLTQIAKKKRLRPRDKRKAAAKASKAIASEQKTQAIVEQNLEYFKATIHSKGAEKSAATMNEVCLYCGGFKLSACSISNCHCAVSGAWSEQMMQTMQLAALSRTCCRETHDAHGDLSRYRLQQLSCHTHTTWLKRRRVLARLHIKHTSSISFCLQNGQRHLRTLHTTSPTAVLKPSSRQHSFPSDSRSSHTVAAGSNFMNMMQQIADQLSESPAAVADPTLVVEGVKFHPAGANS